MQLAARGGYSTQQPRIGKTCQRLGDQLIRPVVIPHVIQHRGGGRREEEAYRGDKAAAAAAGTAEVGGALWGRCFFFITLLCCGGVVNVVAVTLIRTLSTVRQPVLPLHP